MRRIATGVLGLCATIACSEADGGRGSGTLGLPPATSGQAGSGSSGAGDSTGDGGDPTTAATILPTTTDPTGLDGSSSSGEPGGSGTAADTGPAPLACPGPNDPMDCSPGPGSGRGDTCVDDPSCFLDLVQASVNGVIADMPEWFDQSSGQPYVLEVELYMNTVVERVSAAGQCAIRDPNAGDEIAVKHDNAFAENFDILTAEGFARYGDGIYTSKCIPAWF